MRHLKYRVITPIPNTEPQQYLERLFYNRKEVCEYLNISIHTFIYLTSGDMKHTHANKKFLSQIRIERLDSSDYVPTPSPDIYSSFPRPNKHIDANVPSDVLETNYFLSLAEKPINTTKVVYQSQSVR
jgi:hypothetical protein